MNVRELFFEGGPVMFVLLALSVVALTILVVKLLQFFRLRIRDTAFVDEALGLLERDGSKAAMTRLGREANPVARVLETAITVAQDKRLRPQDIEAEVLRVGSGHIRELESMLRGLSAIAHLSPLLGLLGTVTGMIAAFMQLQQASGRPDPGALSGGIWEALLTTAFGLIVAIPAMGAFYALEGEVDRLRGAMKDAAVRVLVHFGRLRNAGAGDGDAENEPALTLR